MWLKELRQMLFSRIRLQKPKRKDPRRRQRWVHLSIDPLEDRTLPSVFVPTIFTDSNAPGTGSLRDAVIAANQDPGKGSDTISLAAGTYTLSIPDSAGGQENGAITGDLDITNTAHKLIIQGQGTSGSNATIINQTVLDRVFQVFGAQVVFQNLVIQGGQAVDDGSAGALPGSTNALGGGILNSDGMVTLNTVVIKSNQAKASNGSNGLGGGIYSVGGSLVISGSSISNNRALGGSGTPGSPGVAGTSASPDGGSGGAGSNGGDAQGGGLFIRGGTLSISGLSVSGNSALGGTGGDGGSGGAGFRGINGANGGTGCSGGNAAAGGNAQGGVAYMPFN